MNCNIYAWGDFENGYSQYPTNYTQNIIKSVFSIFDNTIRDLCAIIRNEDLIYLIYGYQYKKDKRFGVCLEFNRVCPCNINYIYSFFRAIINDILAKGKLLHYTTSGEIQSDVNQLYEQSTVVEDYIDFILHNFNDEQAKFQKIPPINRGTDYNSVAYALDESVATITNALRLHGTIIFLPNKEDESINSYDNVLKQLNKKNIELQNENRVLRRQKNKIIWVLVLISIILVGIVVFFLVMQSKNGIISDLQEDKAKLEKHVKSLQKDSINLENNLNLTLDAKSKIENALTDSMVVINNLRSNITQLAYDYQQLELKYEDSQDQLEKRKNEVTNYRNLLSSQYVVTNIEICNQNMDGDIDISYGSRIEASKSMYLGTRFECHTNKSQKITFVLKLYRPNGELIASNENRKLGFTAKKNFSIQNGKNTCEFSAWGGNDRGHFSAGKYRCEIWVNDIKVGEKQFTLY